LLVAGLVCGVLWEFWNFDAFPKWYYTIPFVGFWKVFEMPLLGYIGYGPFAWEVFAVFEFARSVLVPRQVALVGAVASREERAVGSKDKKGPPLQQALPIAVHEHSGRDVTSENR
jgi:hypothetical protein